MDYVHGKRAEPLYVVNLSLRVVNGHGVADVLQQDAIASLKANARIILGSSPHAAVRLPEHQGISDEHGELAIVYGKLIYSDRYTPTGTRVVTRETDNVLSGKVVQIADLVAATPPEPVRLLFPTVDGLELHLTFERKS